MVVTKKNETATPPPPGDVNGNKLEHPPPPPQSLHVASSSKQQALSSPVADFQGQALQSALNDEILQKWAQQQAYNNAAQQYMQTSLSPTLNQLNGKVPGAGVVGKNGNGKGGTDEHVAFAAAVLAANTRHQGAPSLVGNVVPLLSNAVPVPNKLDRMGSNNNNKKNPNGTPPNPPTTTPASEVAGGDTNAPTVVSKARKPYTISKQRERWTEEEHKRFLEALKLFGRQWRRIEAYIGTKTAVQIRSHAQKFFGKLEKEAAAKENGGGGSKDGTGNGLLKGAESISIPPPRPKRRPAHPYPKKQPNEATVVAASNTTATAATTSPKSEHTRHHHQQHSMLNPANGLIAPSSAEQWLAAMSMSGAPPPPPPGAFAAMMNMQNMHAATASLSPNPDLSTVQAQHGSPNGLAAAAAAVAATAASPLTHSSSPNSASHNPYMTPNMNPALLYAMQMNGQAMNQSNATMQYYLHHIREQQKNNPALAAVTAAACAAIAHAPNPYFAMHQGMFQAEMLRQSSSASVGAASFGGAGGVTQPAVSSISGGEHNKALNIPIQSGPRGGGGGGGLTTLPTVFNGAAAGGGGGEKEADSNLALLSNSNGNGGSTTTYRPVSERDAQRQAYHNYIKKAQLDAVAAFQGAKGENGRKTVNLNGGGGSAFTKHNSNGSSRGGGGGGGVGENAHGTDERGQNGKNSPLNVNEEAERNGKESKKKEEAFVATPIFAPGSAEEEPDNANVNGEGKGGGGGGEGLGHEDVASHTKANRKRGRSKGSTKNCSSSSGSDDKGGGDARRRRVERTTAKEGGEVGGRGGGRNEEGEGKGGQQRCSESPSADNSRGVSPPSSDENEDQMKKMRKPSHGSNSPKPEAENGENGGSNEEAHT